MFNLSKVLKDYFRTRPRSADIAAERLKIILNKVVEVSAVERVRTRALRLLEVHPLWAADACQLAAALVVTQEDPERLAILCFDLRLEVAARKEGFVVNPLIDGSER